MKKHLLLLFCVFSCVVLSAQTSIEGKIIDEETNEGLISAQVALYKNDVFITGTVTDFDGNYAITSIEPGTYAVEAQYTGYPAKRTTGVTVKAGKTNRVNISLSQGVEIETIVIVEYKAPLIEQDNTTQGKTVTAEEIRSLPTKNIAAIAATSAGLATSDSNDDVAIRGSRPDATNYYVDGVRVAAASIPASEIDQLQVITGGMEAKYGDVTGGIISITSKGPSKKYTGGLEVETSEFLDGFGYNLLSGYLSGPILKKKDTGTTLLGFRVAGQFRSIDDRSPSAVGVYRMPLSTIQELEANPVGFLGGSPLPSVQLLEGNPIGDPLHARPNNNNTDYNITGKIDARVTDNIDISISGGLENSENYFIPETGWALLNWHNNPVDKRNGFRTSFRFRHRIGKQGLGEDTENESEGSKSILRNAYYTLQAGFEKRFTSEEDIRHKDNLFGYGYYGNQERTWEPTASIVTDPDNWNGMGQQVDIFGNVWDHLGDQEQLGDFTPGTLNPTLALYTEVNGFTNNPLFTVWNGLHQNVGQVYNRFEKSESDRYTFNLTFGTDLLPGGSEAGRHSIQFGINYEQRVNRFFAVAPERLWALANLQANSHILGVDTTQSVGTFLQDIPGLPGTEFKQYQTLLEEDNEAAFYKNIREALGISLNERINIDGLSPDQLRLDYFSAAELNNFGLINYYGYDYTGDKYDGNSTFNEFFTSVDPETGVRDFKVAPLRPIYGAAYIQDKFSYKDIIFRLGLRVDYFDANTKVLRTPHSLYAIETAEQYFARREETMPDNIDPNYEVYLTSGDSDDLLGYRQGDQFFLPNGTEVSNGALLFGGGLVNPSYEQKDETLRNIQLYDVDDETGELLRFNPDDSFEDYTPQINFMPRLAFSFPISEDANFFAHYDILVQRPPSGTGATARSYYYFNNPDRTPLSNPNLTPETTIDYEVGFQQKLSGSSAIKISAYYKELRDMIQRRTYLFIPAPVNNYEAFGNLDFGTVKGFSFGYDLRRTNNIQFNATYTLQFAEGTGSDANSSQGLNSRGNIRTLLPLSYDERHRLTGVLDYRYGSGKAYNGPRIGNADIFANAGANLIMTAVSGRPYTRFSTPQSINNGEGSGYIGAINGARLPWIFDVDLRIDKSFSFKLGKAENARALNCTAYLRVENLLDTRNIIGVFPVTASADDDGYIVSSFGRDNIEQVENIGADVTNFLSSYQARLLDPGNYTLPRRIYIGAMFDF